VVARGVSEFVDEASFEDAVIDMARLLGWTVHAERRARTAKGWRTPVKGHVGFPDLVLVHPAGGVIFAELKTDHGKSTIEQFWWADTLRRAGAEHYLWRPKDWDAIEKRLKQRRGGE